jgi:hypothetical protein
MTFIINKLLQALRTAAIYNPEVQTAPACILWPDHGRQWEMVIPRLQNELPELFVLGDYNSEKRTGPAIWLRCVIANKIESITIPEGVTPIFYLPGVGRQDLRAVESCPDYLKPLAELQYRGVIWSQLNTKDWTILAFLKSDQGGLGLDVAQDNDSKSAMQHALSKLLDEDIELLKGKRLDKDYFNTLLTSGDYRRDLLMWFDQGEAFQAGLSENEWHGFVEVCKSKLAFDPENDGILTGALKLANHEGPWQTIWERFCEAPKRYINIPTLIRKCNPPNDNLLWHMDQGDFDGWPQWNESREIALRNDLMSLDNHPPHEARKQIMELEKRHSGRRKLVWTTLGESSLALALKHLATLAKATENTLAAGKTDDLVTGYCNSGWRADDAVIKAMACVDKQGDFEAVQTAIRAIYLPWAEEAARYLQNLVEDKGYPGLNTTNHKAPDKTTGECILFVDGLRFDTARRLSELLTKNGLKIEEKTTWAALPSVTATGKPAVTPVRHLIKGQQAKVDFEPCIAENGKSLKGGYQLQKLLTESGWEVLKKTNTGDSKGQAWCEFGDIDHEGHDRGWKLAKHLDSILTEISDRVEHLLSSGWQNIRIVTDHGWLLIPGGLPKIDLPVSLTENKWGRCATIKSGAVSEERLYPWYWNPDQSFALADGISCYRKGEEYAHGGLSLQECLTLELTVSTGKTPTYTNVKIADVEWKGLRCKVRVDGEFSGLSLDLRTQPGNSSSSKVADKKPKQVKEDGIASVVVVDEDLEGTAATIVLLDSNDQLIAQINTVIGGGKE